MCYDTTCVNRPLHFKDDNKNDDNENINANSSTIIRTTPLPMLRLLPFKAQGHKDF